MRQAGRARAPVAHRRRLWQRAAANAAINTVKKFFNVLYRSDKEALAEKFLDYPLLNALLRMLLYEPWIRVVFLVFLLLAPPTALFPLRIWTVSERGLKPVIKVSGLDLAQAWALKRRAGKHTTAGHYKDAMYYWKAAAAKNRP